MTISAHLAKSTGASPKLTLTPSPPPSIAVAIPIRYPPNAVAKNTAGKYGVKNTSGRIWERTQRAAVAKARLDAANPMLKSGDGSDIPCQARRNSSINFTIRHITSAEQRIQNKAKPQEIRGLRRLLWWKANAACVVPSGRRYTYKQHRQTRGERHGTTRGQGRGHHRCDQRHRVTHC